VAQYALGTTVISGAAVFRTGPERVPGGNAMGARRELSHELSRTLADAERNAPERDALLGLMASETSSILLKPLLEHFAEFGQGDGGFETRVTVEIVARLKEHVRVTYGSEAEALFEKSIRQALD
jgi:hypothetical protein